MRIVLELSLVLVVMAAALFSNQIESATERRQWEAIQKMIDNQARLIVILERKPPIVVLSQLKKSKPSGFVPNAKKVAANEQL